MSFASPLWLAALLPWLAAAIWLFTGRRERAQVPFLHLWKGLDAAPPRARAAIEWPPLPILCAILAMLLAILGAARPQLTLARNGDQSAPIPASRPLPSNIGIVTASASVYPKPQVMIRVRNDSDNSEASLEITSAGHESTARIDLPPRGQEKNYFVDLNSMDATVSIELTRDVPDDNSADNHATLSLAHSSPIIEMRGDLPPQVQRIIAAYAKLKPASAGAARIIVSSEAIGPDQPAVILAVTDLSQDATVPHVTDHPINAHVDWAAVMHQTLRLSSAAAPGAGWQTIVSAGDHPLVAVRESSARQVWIGFTSDSWPRTSDFVIFWTNVLDWIGQVQDGSHYTFQGGGIIPPPAPTNWQARPGGEQDLTSAFLVASIAIIFVSALAWATCKNCASG